MNVPPVVMLPLIFRVLDPPLSVPPESVTPPPMFKVLVVPALSVPAVTVTAPEIVCTRLVPMLRVPPEPLAVSEAADTGSFSVAVPPVFVDVTLPVVVNPSMLCVPVPAKVIAEAFPTNVPLFTKLPPNVRAKLLPEVLRVAPKAMERGTPVLNTFAAFNVIAPVLAIVTPPVAANGVIHSRPAVREVAVLYCKVADPPYVGATETVAVSSIDKTWLTVTPVVVFVPLPAIVRL